MKIYDMSSKKLKKMNKTELQNVLKQYDEIRFTESYHEVSLYLIQQRKAVHHFAEKIDFIIHHFVEKENCQLNYVLDCLLDNACYALDLETVKIILQKGYKIDGETFYFKYESPLFRTFFYNHYVQEYKEMNTLQKENLKKIGKLLIQHGVLLEAHFEGSGNEKKTNFVELAKTKNLEHVLSYMEDYQPLFNPTQQKQWKTMRLSALF